MRNISIRRGTVRDAERISKLLTELAEEFIVKEFSPEGRSHLLGELSATEVEQRLAGDFRFYLAEDGQELAGGRGDAFKRSSVLPIRRKTVPRHWVSANSMVASERRIPRPRNSR